MVLFQVEKRSVRMCPLRTIFIFPIIFVGTSESPDRDCCEPLYPFISTKSPNPANNNNSSKLTLIWPLAGYYQGCSFPIWRSFQFSVKYWEKIHSSKNLLIWYFTPCPFRQSHYLTYTFNETYIFKITKRKRKRTFFEPISDFFTFLATFSFFWPRS